MAHSSRLETILGILREQYPVLAQEYQISGLELFGSFVRHEQKKGSDLDILVTFSRPPSLLKFVQLENHLTDILGIQVDLVMKKSLKPGIEKIIRGEAIPV